ncbi:MAG: hypothetical protein Q9181_007459 [Wetmoreana brouardii]
MVILSRIHNSATFRLPTLLLLHQGLRAAAQYVTDDGPTPTFAPIATDIDLYGHTTHAPSPADAFATYFGSLPTDGAPATATSDSLPSASHQDTDKGILNYYFLLLAFLIILIGIAYLFYARRQRQKIALSRRNGQRALARDLERWGGGGPWGPGRFRGPRTSPRQPRREREEGLDERGEAPPPYLPKEPEPTHFGGHGGDHDIPLQDMGRGSEKPPDYDEGPSSPSANGRSRLGPVRYE